MAYSTDMTATLSGEYSIKSEYVTKSEYTHKSEYTLGVIIAAGCLNEVLANGLRRHSATPLQTI